MTQIDRPTADELAKQIADFRGVEWRYCTYAQALRRVLETACHNDLQQTVVTARVKDLASFAEKCVRKWDKYKDPLRQFSDLCGARVIVQTLSQVEDVRRFVDQNFVVVETEDVSLRLGDKEFGYRDRHYIVRLKKEEAPTIGFTAEEMQTVGNLKAEVQIRTWAQHAWADTLHHRTYKSPFKPTAEVQRTAALVAALMEDGDRNFDRLAGDLDGLAANYAASHDRDTLQQEIELQDLVRQHVKSEDLPPLALQLAALHAARGDQDKVIELLAPQEHTDHVLREAIRLELGTALCRQHRRKSYHPDAEYLRGCRLIAGVVKELDRPQGPEVLNFRRRESLRARALSRLGWASEVLADQAAQASESHRRALELQPANPYYLANVLGFELKGGAPGEDVVRCLGPAMLEAVRACEAHAAQDLELPFAFFTAGRLRLLLGQCEAAFHDYLRGAYHCLNETSCVGAGVLDDEIAWLHRIWPRHALPQEFEFAKAFLLLAKRARHCPEADQTPTDEPPAARAVIAGPVVIIAGGAASIGEDILNSLRAPLTEALGRFRGTVISGGTRVGVPGLVGDIAEQLKQSGACGFTLIGYRPASLRDELKDDRYDQSICVGETGFSAEQILANWTDILAADIDPQAVRVLGIGGGPVAAVEYRLALAIGAEVGVLAGTKGTGEALLSDPLWKGFKNLLPLPCDPATLRAFLNHTAQAFDPRSLDEMAQELHARFVAENPNRLTENLRPWPNLPATYQEANREQARYAVEILKAAGFGVRKAIGGANAITSFAGAEDQRKVDEMAELEHGRWNVERLRAGWRPGRIRDNEHKIQPFIVPWANQEILKNDIKDYDRQAVRAFPDILAKAGLEVFLPAKT